MAEMFDLDQARAARREAQGEPPQFTFGGETFTLPIEIPLAVADAFTKSNIDGLEALFGKEQWERFLAHDPTDADLGALAPWMDEIYGFGDLGKSSPSPKSSKRTGSSSRRTSNASTGSTSRRRAGVKAG